MPHIDTVYILIYAHTYTHSYTYAVLTLSDVSERLLTDSNRISMPDIEIMPAIKIPL